MTPDSKVGREAQDEFEQTTQEAREAVKRGVQQFVEDPDGTVVAVSTIPDRAIQAGVKKGLRAAAGDKKDQAKIVATTTRIGVEVAAGEVLAGARGTGLADDAVRLGDDIVSGQAPAVRGRIARVGGGATEVIEINPSTLRWSQTTAGLSGGKAERYRKVLQEQGWVFPPIDVVQTADGLVTVDHTRTAIALELGIERIPAHIHLPGDPLPSSMLSRTWNRANQTATTWGEAVALRGAGQTPRIGPTGSPIPPRTRRSPAK